MSVPDYQSFMLPLLKITSDGKEHSLQDTSEILAKEFKLTELDLNEMLASGRKTRFYDRVGWASTYLRKAGLLVSHSRGLFQITQRGIDVLKESPPTINVKYLKRFDEFVEFQKRSNKQVENPEVYEIEENQTPEEAIENAYQRIRQGLSDEILQTVKNCTPLFFERREWRK